MSHSRLSSKHAQHTPHLPQLFHPSSSLTQPKPFLRSSTHPPHPSRQSHQNPTHQGDKTSIPLPILSLITASQHHMPTPSPFQKDPHKNHTTSPRPRQPRAHKQRRRSNYQTPRRRSAARLRTALSESYKAQGTRRFKNRLENLNHDSLYKSQHEQI